MEGNIAVFDECKGKNTTLFCFAGIVFRNETIYQEVKAKIEGIKAKYPQLLKGEAKSRGLHEKNTNLINYLNECFPYLMSLAERGYLKIHFHLMYGKDYSYDCINLLNAIIETYKRTTKLTTDDEIIKSSYFELNCFLIKYMDELHFSGDYLQTIYSDNAYSLLQKNKEKITGVGNVFQADMNTENISALEIQGLHNSLNKLIKKNIEHQGLNNITFLDSKENVIVQMCDFLASCIYNSVAYLFCEKHGYDSSDYKFKFDFISRHIPGIDGLDVNNLNLSYDLSKKELICNGKFENIDGVIQK